MANDVKVTLTADDQATEIVRKLAGAVKQLDAQQRSSNAGLKDAASASASATSAFSGFQKAIAGVAAALGAIRVIEFVRDTIQAADQIGKLAQKTGATTEALSVLSVAASTADLSQESLGNSLKFLARSFTELQQGVPATAEAFAALGLSAKDLKGLSLDQVLVKIAEAQDKFGDGAGKTAALLKIFGRNGEEIIPLLHDLANGGFDQATKKAKDLGLVMGGDATNAARQFDDAMATLKNSFKGLVIELTPLIKGIADMAAGLAAFVAHHGDLLLFATAATSAGFAIRGIVTAVTALRGAIAVGGIAALFTIPGAVIAGLALVAGALAEVVKLYIQARDAKKQLEQPLASDPTLDAALGINKAKPQVNLQDAAQRKALIDAQLAAAKQALKDELAATEENLKKEAEEVDASYAKGLVSLREFYAQKTDIIVQGIAAQRKELEAEKAAVEASPLSEDTQAARVKKASEVKAIEAQIARLKTDGEVQVLALQEQERQGALQLKSELEGFAQQIANATGDIIGGQQVAIEAAARKYEETLKRVNGLSTDFINEQRDAFVQLLTDRAAFEEKQRQGEREFADLQLQRDAITAKVKQGLISEREGQLQIAEAERSRLPALQEAADAMAAFAEATKDPALKQAAQQFQASFAGLGKVVDESTIKLANLRDTLLSTVQSDLAGFLGDTISHVNSLTEAFGALAQSIVSSFQRVLGDIIASKAVEAIRGLFEGAASATPQVAAAAATATSAAALGAAGTTVLGAATFLAGSAGALDASGGILITAAGALAAAAAALAAAGAANGAGALLLLTGGFATGGPVKGPGTGTSDSILARLSAGEYVLRADAVRKLGLPFLDALNGLRTSSLRRFSAGLPAFATGGLVAGGGGSASVSGGLDITVSAAPGSSLDALRTSGGLKVLREVIGGNPQMFKAALGIV